MDFRVLSARGRALHAVATRRARLLVASAQALLPRVASPERLLRAALDLRPGSTIEPHDLAELLVDAGFSGRQTAQRLAHIGRSLDDVDAILVSHEHSDHVAGLGAVCKKKPVPIFANRLTAEQLQEDMPDLKTWKIFQGS